MSRAVAFRAVALLLLAVAAFAQPMVNAPLLNRVGFVSDGSSTASLPATVAGAFAFTTAYNSTSGNYTVVALNLTSDSSTGAPAFSMMLPTQPSIIFAATRERVGVICDSWVLFFGANWTNVWYVGNVSAPGVTFDITQLSSTHYDLPAVGWWGSVFLGSQNKSSTDSSAIYHINATTAMIINHTIVPYYWSNYRLQFDMTTPDVIYALARRWYTSPYNYFILPIWISNMTMGTPINTMSSYSAMRFNVHGGIAAVIDSGSYWSFINLTTGTAVKTGSLYSCSSSSLYFEPGMIGGRWLIACGSYLSVFDNMTLNLLSSITAPSGSGGFTAAIAENWSANGTVVVAAGQYVYVVNGTVPALVQIGSVNFTSNGYTPTPTAALFVFNTSIVEISYRGYYSNTPGGVVGFDTMTGKAVGQITNVNPVGWGIWLPELGLDIVSSTMGPVLAAYNNWFNDTLPAFVTQISSMNSVTRALVANGTLGYYFAYNYIYRVNLTTGTLLSTVTTSAGWSTSYGPVIVGEYACYNAYSTTYCVTATSTSAVNQPTCTPSSRTPFSVSNGVLYILCSGGDLYSWAVSDTSSPYSVSGYISYTPAVVGTTALIQTSSTGFSGYTVPLTSASPSTKFTISNIYAYSSIAPVGEAFAFMGYTYTLAADKLTVTATSEYMLYVYSQSGSKVGSIVIPGMSSAVAIATRSGGQFGSQGWAFVFNGTYMAGVNLNSMKVVYQVAVDLLTGVQGSPFVTSQGGICFYGASYNRFYMFSAFNGELAWWAPASTGSNSMTPIEASGAIYYSTGTSVVAADIFTGAERTSVGFASTTINGFAVWNNSATNQSSIFVTTTDNVIIATSAYIMPSTGYFAGGGGSGSGDDGSKKSMAWIAGVVIGVLVAVILVVVIIKKKGSGSTGDTDYVPMNPATQV